MKRVMTEEHKKKMADARKLQSSHAVIDEPMITDNLFPKQVVALASVSPKHKSTYKRAMLKTLSPRQAIRIKCYECNNFEDAISRTKDCNISICPLWAYRPQRKEMK